MDPSLKYSEILECREYNPVLDILEKPIKKPNMVYEKSSVLAKVLDLLPRLQEQKDSDVSEDINIEDCKDNEPYIEMNAVGIVKDSESEVDPKMVLLQESENDASSSDEDESDDEIKLIEDISEESAPMIKNDTDREVPSLEFLNEEVVSSDLEISEEVTFLEENKEGKNLPII